MKHCFCLLYRHKQLWRYTIWTATDCRGTWKQHERRTQCCRKATLRLDAAHKQNVRVLCSLNSRFKVVQSHFVMFGLYNCSLSKIHANNLTFFVSFFSVSIFFTLIFLFARLFLSVAEAAGGGMGGKSERVGGRDAEMWGCPQCDGAGRCCQGWLHKGMITSTNYANWRRRK